MSRRLFAIVWLAAVWVALWGEVTWANAVAGLATGVAVVALVPVRDPRPTVYFRPHRAVHFAAFLLWRMVVASAEVAWEVVSPGRYQTAIVAVPLFSASPAIISLSCIAIGITPGTMVVEVREDPPTLFVHVLRSSDLEQSRADVLRLERMIEQTLPSRLLEAPST